MAEINNDKYKPEYCEGLIKHMSQGYSYDTFGAKVGVTRKTLYNWEDRHPEWREAKDKAFALSQDFFEKRLIGKLAGQEINGFDPRLVDTSCLIFALKTRYHKTYGERNKVEHSGEKNISVSYPDPRETDHE